MAPRAILFDLDGTLVDTKDLYLEAYRRALSAATGRLLSDAELLAAQPRSEAGVLRLFAQDAQYDQAVERFHQHYRELHGALCGGLYDGVLDMLASLRNRAVPIGIVTGKSRRAWEITCSAFELGPFAVLVFDDDVAAPKPDPCGLLAAAAALGLEPAEIVYVGDSVTDLEAAHAAGMRPVAALWSKSPVTRPRLVDAAERLRAVTIEEPGAVIQLL